MGIESDQLVFDYLSRVGDLAQQRQLPSATRMRLVSELRNEIDRRRSQTSVDSPATVRRILARLGSPDEIVTAAGDGTPGPAPEPRATVPVQRADGRDSRPKGLRRVVPRPRPAEPDPVESSRDIPSPPHLAGTDELGDSSAQPDWWRVDNSPFGVGDSVPGFVGGVEIPEILKPPSPPEKPEKPEKADAPAAKDDGDIRVEPGAEPAAEPRVRTRRLRLRPGGGWSNPLLLLAAALLVAGAVLGSLSPGARLVALGLGWLIAYASRRLTAAESKWAVLGMPGLVATAGIVWLWGRQDGRWGDPIAEGHMSDAITETWPWVFRGAALASALYLVWRSQRQR